MKGYLHLYKWADSLTECGYPNEVGTGMIDKIKGVIREAYRNGFKDGEKGITPAKVQTRRGIRGRRFSGSTC